MLWGMRVSRDTKCKDDERKERKRNANKDIRRVPADFDSGEAQSVHKLSYLGFC